MLLLTEREVHELAGETRMADGFPRPVQYGPEGRKWDKDAVTMPGCPFEEARTQKEDGQEAAQGRR